VTETALLLTGGILDESNAKTAHGLIRGPSRFRLLAVVDDRHAGRDAGEVVDGQVRRLPCFATLDEALTALPEAPDWVVVGVAFHGGRMPDEMRRLVLESVRRGIGAVNGLHELLADDPEIAAAAAASGARPARHPPDAEGRRAALLDRRGAAPRRTACRRARYRLRTRQTHDRDPAPLRPSLARPRGGARHDRPDRLAAGHRYGFILDATPNDFVTGELERAVVACAREASPS